jgi:Tfp pilus assembly protein PilE
MTVLATASYRGYIERANRTEAMEALLLLQNRQEDFRNINNTYTADLDALGFPGGCTQNCMYMISFTVAPDTRTFTARAEPTPGGGTNGVDQSGDDNCQWFSIDARSATNAGPSDTCWEGR